MDYRVRAGDLIQDLSVEGGEHGYFKVQSGDVTHEVHLQAVGKTGLYSMIIDGRSYQLYAQPGIGVVEVVIGGQPVTVDVLPASAGAAASLPHEAGAGPALSIKAPMPGVINDVYVEPGQAVERGARLLVLEAMKMNNEIRAPRAGVVQAVKVAKGERINKDQVMVVLE